jgi:CubicO group peptidase (beta-lactamase class C family)
MKKIKLITFCFIVIPGLISCQVDTNKVEIIPAEFKWENATPESQGFSSVKIDSLIAQLSKKGSQNLLIIRNDKIISDWSREGGDDSSINSRKFTSMLTGRLAFMAAMDDGYIFPDEPVGRHIPSWRRGQKHQISIRHLATHTSGLEHFGLPHIENIRINLADSEKKDNPSSSNFINIAMDSARILFRPGTRYHYSLPGSALLSYIITSNLKDSPYSNINSYLKDRIIDPVGIKENEYSLGLSRTLSLEGLDKIPDLAGNTFSPSAMARIGRLMLNKGQWQGKQVISSSIVEEVIKPYRVGIPIRDRNMHHASLNINNKMILAPALGWYSNYNGVLSYLPRDAFITGLPEGDLLLVIPSLNLIVVHIGDVLADELHDETFWSAAEDYLFNPLIEAFEELPYPMSDLVSSVEFAPKDSVVQLARGSDTWPITWADDGNLYTAYGDGNGFEPFTEYKLSMGIGMVKGNPPNIEGINIRNRTAEIPGDGPFGAKACGMLMVDKVLYMFVRNAGNSQLAWSSDYGQTWEWADWHFEFVYPTFVNYGKNYEGAIDDYVYIYSHDSEHFAGAYLNSDYMVMARVYKSGIKDWREYEYFAGYSKNNKPLWSEDIRKREAVFINPGKCYRSGISYNKGLGRYLWCQTIGTPTGQKHGNHRFRGGLGIFESTTPWGPWKTVYYTLDWDIGPGETSSIPPKWMSEDGKTCHFLSSTDDYFSVRKVIFTTE